MKLRFYLQERKTPCYIYSRQPGDYPLDPSDRLLAEAELPAGTVIPNYGDLTYLLEEEFAGIYWGRGPCYLGICLGMPHTFFEWKAKHADLIRLVREAAASVKK